MNILMVAQFAMPIIGGEEQHVINLSCELVRRGHQVAIASIKHKKQSGYETYNGVRIYRLQGTLERVSGLFDDETRRHAPPFPDPEITLGLRRIIEKEKPDIVHAHNWLGYSYLPLVEKKKTGFVVTLHDYSLRCATKRFMYLGKPCSGPGFIKCIRCSSEHYGILRGAPIYLSNQVMGFLEGKSVDMFLTVSQVTAENNGLVGSSLPYKVVPNFFLDDLGGEPERYPDLLRQLPAGDFLLFVGDLSREKGIQVLLSAYTELKNPPPLVLIGRTTDETPRGLPSNVLNLGSWPHEAVLQAWKMSCMALIPSVWLEPFGMVVIEAMSAGCPIIASDTGGISDIVEDNISGILVTPGDSESLKQAMNNLLEHPELRKRLGAGAQARSLNYLASNIVPQIEQIYNSITRNKQPR